MISANSSASLERANFSQKKVFAQVWCLIFTSGFCHPGMSLDRVALMAREAYVPGSQGTTTITDTVLDGCLF